MQDLHRRPTAGVIGALMLGVALAVGVGAAGAQQPEPQSVVPGTAAIWTDQSQYQIGGVIQYCYRVPVAGQITITDLAADGTSRVIYAGPSGGTQGCQTGTVTPPAGTECLRLTYPLPPGTGTTQTCFQVVGPTPPPQPSGASISTNRSSYRIGDPIHVCYRVPGPGNVTITDTLANGTSQTFYFGYDDGTGACLPGTITPPAGTECMTLVWTPLAATLPTTPQRATAQTCFQVTGSTPPSGFIEVGSALIDPDGSWSYNAPVLLTQPGLTYARVTSGACADSPVEAAVWEGNLTRQSSNQVGIEVFAGELDPIGLTVNTATGGYGYIARPLTATPETEVSLILFGIPGNYVGVRLTVCLRTP